VWRTPFAVAGQAWVDLVSIDAAGNVAVAGSNAVARADSVMLDFQWWAGKLVGGCGALGWLDHFAGPFLPTYNSDLDMVDALAVAGNGAVFVGGQIQVAEWTSQTRLVKFSTTDGQPLPVCP